MATSAMGQVTRLRQTNLGVKAFGKCPIRESRQLAGCQGSRVLPWALVQCIGAMQFRLGLRAHMGTGRYQWWELRRRRWHNNGLGRRFHAIRRGVLRGRQVHNGQREHVDMGSRHWQRWLLSGGSIPSQAQAMARSQPREVPSLSSESGEWMKSRKLGQSTIQWRMVIATKISGGQYITPKNILKSGTAARHPLNA